MMESNMNARELLAFAAKAAVQTFRQNGEVIPVLHIVDDNGNHIPFHWAGGFEDHHAKQSTSEIMRKALKAAHAVRYALIMEAWAVDEHGHTELAMDMSSKGISLESHPDSIEVITIFVEDKLTKECLSRMYRILRPERGKPRLVPPRDLDLSKDGSASGRFNNLFEDEA
jgi:hypothetical protein